MPQNTCFGENGGDPMATVNLTRVIEKMKLENVTPEVDVRVIKVTQPDILRSDSNNVTDD